MVGVCLARHQRKQCSLWRRRQQPSSKSSRTWVLRKIPRRLRSFSCLSIINALCTIYALQDTCKFWAETTSFFATFPSKKTCWKSMQTKKKAWSCGLSLSINAAWLHMQFTSTNRSRSACRSLIAQPAWCFLQIPVTFEINGSNNWKLLVYHK